jgi:hypothetical protein
MIKPGPGAARPLADDGSTDQSAPSACVSGYAERRDVEAFRIRNDIVSLQRDENEVLARVRNLSTSLSAANDRVAAAEGKVRALSASAAAGKAAVRSRDDPTLANIEQRASQIREELHDLEGRFTPDYLAKDPSHAGCRRMAPARDTEKDQRRDRKEPEDEFDGIERH